MRIALRYLLIPCLLLPGALRAVGDAPELCDLDVLYSAGVRRNYLNTSRYFVSSHAVVLEGTPSQIARLSYWLDQIRQLPYGKATLEAIHNSGNQLTIRHSTWALLSSGRTLAPVTDDLTNGRGADVLIYFDARIPDTGSHRVFGADGNSIAFTAVQNLFHELAHARFMMTGEWRYFDSEGQAITAENRFRRQEGLRAGMAPDRIPRREGVEGERIWSPGTRFARVE